MEATHASKLVPICGLGHAALVSSSATHVAPVSIIANVATLENFERALQNHQFVEEGAEKNVNQVSPNPCVLGVLMLVSLNI